VRLAAGALAAALALLAPVAPAAAQGLRAEGRGTAPLPAEAGRSPRNEALAAALADAVEGAARGLVGGAADPAAQGAVREALGPDPARFAQGYRRLSEQERARADGPGRELVVIVEAQIDAAQLSEALRRAGLLATQAAPPPLDPARRIVIEPVPSWGALEALRGRLRELGAAGVRLERVEPERAVLVLEGERSAASLVAALAAAPPLGVGVRALGEHDGSPRLRLDEGAPAN
jgi:hypothetical protein